MRRRTSDQPAEIGLPTVNLLSQSEFDRISARRLRRRFAVGAAALLVLAGAGWGVQHARVAEAEKLLAVEQSETARVQAQTRELAPVRAYVGGVDVQKRTVEDAMAQEMYFSEVLDGVRAAAPDGAVLGAVSVAVGGPAADAASSGAAGNAGCPGPDPFATRTVVGCVTLSGTAQSRAQVGEMVVALGRSKLFVEPFISTTTTDDQSSVSFSGSVGLSEKVYSLRYVPDEAAAAGADDAVDGPATMAGGTR